MLYNGCGNKFVSSDILVYILLAIFRMKSVDTGGIACGQETEMSAEIQGSKSEFGGACSNS